MIVRHASILLSLAALATLCPATVLVTMDGQRYEGEITRTDTGWTVTQADGKVQTVTAAQVKSIEASRDRSEISRAAGDLESLRRSVDFSNDLPKIIERYEGFITQTSDATVRDNAKKDLATWQQRRDAGLIKVGKTWVTQQQAEQIAKDNIQAVSDARAMMKAGQLPDALQNVNRLLEQDPENISALYLLGVMQAKQSNFIEARKSFTRLQQTIPTHSPTSFDLAVILTRQNQWGPACGAMEQAITATPNVRLLLDATAELLHLVPLERRNISAAQRLAKIFLAQDALLQKEMAKQHLYRWGASWVDQATHDKLRQSIDATDQKIKDLQTDFDKSQQRQQAIDKQFADNDFALRQIEAHSFVLMPDGTTIHTPYPPAYYDLKSQNGQLRNERSDLGIRIDALQKAARDTRTQYPQPTYSGVIHLIEEDGVPIVGPVAPPAATPAPSSPSPATTPAGPIIRIGPANAGPNADH